MEAPLHGGASFFRANLVWSFVRAERFCYTRSMKNSMTKKSTVKMGISIDGSLADEADALAREMDVTRSGLYAMALREFMLRRDNASLLEKLNQAYGEPDPEDERLVRGIKTHSRRMLDEYER